MNLKAKLYAEIVGLFRGVPVAYPPALMFEGKEVHIFCPGASSERSQKHYENSGGQVALGINGFILHSRPCDVYFWEASPLKENRTIMLDYIRRNIRQPIYVPHQSKSYHNELRSINNISYYRTIPFACELHQLEHNIKRYLTGSTKRYAFYGSGSSLIRAMNIALLCHPRSIHIHGLDLTADYIPAIEQHNINTQQNSSVHITEQPQKKIKVTDYFSALTNVLPEVMPGLQMHYHGTNERLKSIIRGV